MNSFDIRIPYVEVRNRNRDIIGIIEGAEIFFEYALHGSGEFEIYCRSTQNNLSLLKKDNYVTLPVNADTTEYQIEKNCNIWIIEKIERANSRTGGRWITASGREAKQIVDRRIVKNTAILNANKNLISEIKTKLFEPNLINPTDTSRKINGFIFVDTSDIITKNIDDETQVSYENLFDYSEEFYLKYGIGAKLRFKRDTKEMPYTIYKGENKSNLLVFSRGNENLLSTNYIEDWTEYKTCALVGGEEKEYNETHPTTGEVINTYTKRAFIDITDKNEDIDKREVFVDARDLHSEYEEKIKNAQGVEITTTKYYNDITYNAMLKERGLEKLASENNKKIEFTGEIDVTNDRYRFNIDYYLGDVVKIRDDDFGTETLVRVSKFIKVQNEEGYKEYFEYETYEEVE